MGDFTLIGNPWDPHHFSGIKEIKLSDPIKSGCHKIYPSGNFEQFPLHWTQTGLVINIWLKRGLIAKNDPRKQLPTTPELTLHFLHTDAQQDDVIPVLKVRLTFGTNQKDAVLVTGSKHLKSPFQPVRVDESLHLSTTEFTPYQVSLSCNSIMECSINIMQDERMVLKREIGQFGPFIQPNIATFSASRGSEMVVKIGCELKHGEACMDDLECISNSKCLRESWKFGDMLSHLKQGSPASRDKKCSCEPTLIWNGISCS